MDDEAAIDRIYGKLVRGQLGEADLSARGIAALVGRTTGSVYHRWGSLDGLLFALSQRGFADLGVLLLSSWDRTHDLGACATAYVTFALDHPALYSLMFERRFDWAALRAFGSFDAKTPGSELLVGVVCLLESGGSKRALEDTRLLMAGLHGIVSLAASGRMNAGALGRTDREVALASATDLAARILSAKKKRVRT